MLARAVIRQREMAVRQSLGASRFRVLLLMVSEGLALSLTGWLGSFGFIVVVSKLVPRLLQADLDLTPDWRAAFLSLVLILLSTIAFMLAPALGAWRQHVLPWLKAGEQGIVGGRSNLSNFLAIVQLAFAVLLLTAAGLAWRSLSLVDPNLRIDKDNLLVVTVNTAGSASSAETNQILLDRLSDRLRAINRVSMVSHLRNRPDIFWSELAVRSDAAQEPVLASSNVAGPGYLRTIGVTPILGRDFSDADTERTDKSVIINQNLADSLWPGEAAIGRTVMVGPRSEPMQVIGVAPNAFFGSFTGKQKPNFIFLSARQSPSTPGDTTYYIRYRDGSDTIATAVTTALKETDSHVSVVRSRTMEEVLADVLRPLTVVTSLLSIFATGSLAIAAIGLYGAVAFSMVRRTREFGVRMALGASTNQVLTSVMREGLLLTLAGLAGGMTLSVIAGLAMRRLLYGVTPTDGLTYVGVFVLLATASLLACYFPARRASRVDPLVSLRHE
jgi:putative ABC transport system permease protein